MQFIHATDHRPYPKPDSPWGMYQEWHNLLFAHWPVEAALLRSHLPASLTLDTFEGQAWVGVVPFQMKWVRPRWLPSVPWLSFFNELNVRTYVRVGERSGVYFFSLEASNPIAVRLARRFFYLPYMDATMRCQVGTEIAYESVRTHKNEPPAAFRATYQPTGDVYYASAGSLEEWLTERYCLYTTHPQGKVMRGEIQHVRWPLQRATAKITLNTMASAAGITLPDVPPLLHFVKKIAMVAWYLTNDS